VLAQFGHQAASSPLRTVCRVTRRRCLPFEIVGAATTGRLRPRPDGSPGRFDLIETQPVARSRITSVDAAHHPEVAIGITTGGRHRQKYNAPTIGRR